MECGPRFSWWCYGSSETELVSLYLFERDLFTESPSSGGSQIQRFTGRISLRIIRSNTLRQSSVTLRVPSPTAM